MCVVLETLPTARNAFYPGLAALRATSKSCLRFGWSVRPHWNSNYVIFQTPANDQMCGKRLSTCLTEAEMPAPTPGTKTPARWAFNHTHPSTAPFYITTFVLPQTLLWVILTKVPTDMCLEGTISSARTHASWSTDMENILECAHPNLGLLLCKDLVQSILPSQRHKSTSVLLPMIKTSIL